MKKREAYEIYQKLTRTEKGNWATECGYQVTKGLYRYLTYNEDEDIKPNVLEAFKRVISVGRMLELTNKVDGCTGDEYMRRLKEKWDNCGDLIKDDIVEEDRIIVRSLVRIQYVDGKPVIVYPVLDSHRRDTNSYRIAWQG